MTSNNAQPSSTSDNPYHVGEAPTYRALADVPSPAEEGGAAQQSEPSKPRVSESYMVETHLGGRLESVPGFDARVAMTDGFKSSLLTSGSWGIGATAGHGSDQAEGSPVDRPVAESIFDQGHDWVPIGDTTVIPWRCVVHLEIVYENWSRALGTGWFSAKDTIITAGHNVYSKNGDGWARRIRIVPGRKGGYGPFGETHAQAVDALPGWQQSGGRKAEFDLGVIKTADPDIGRRTGWFGWAAFADDHLRQKPLIQSAGYPGETKPYATQWYDAGRVTDFSDHFINYRVDTEGGNSGGPIFFSNDSGQRWVIATHVYGRNRDNLGLRINDQIFNAIAAWSR